jgi:uncharacterized zinc-type alcohol dehydrogenase-like protein
MTVFRGYAAKQAGGTLEPFEFEPGELKPEQVDIKVESCGICHSDLSLLDDAWGMTQFPLVPGHEVVGTVVAAGEAVKRVKVGQKVGLGWFSESCMSCPSCLSGDHNLCGSPEQTAVGRHGGFADHVRCHWVWATPLPDGFDGKSAGPLFCGGITVFNPIVQLGIKPTDHVGVVGIGGLGHMALQFLDKWGCDVTAFTSSDAKAEQARQLGADQIVNSRDSDAIAAIAGDLDLVLVTVNVSLDWDAYLSALGKRGRLHMVGAVLEPIPVGAFPLILGQKSISGSPLGSPATTATMIDFCQRHEIKPMTEHFPMSQVNEAIEHLRAGKARYRVVLDSDF